MMKKFAFTGLVAFALAVMIPTLYANPSADPIRVPLNKVIFQLTAEQWATTSTAKVIVGVNAALTDAALGQIHSQIMSKLKKIAKSGQWHITRFSRSKNSSGLEQISVQAEARLPETELAALRQRAKAVSKAGENYRVLAIHFTPSTAEIQNTRTQLRTQLYQQARAELSRLNKVYPKESFYLHRIEFITRVPIPVARPMILAKMPTPAGAMVVSDKVIVNARVVLASSYQSLPSKQAKS